MEGETEESKEQDCSTIIFTNVSSDCLLAFAFRSLALLGVVTLFGSFLIWLCEVAMLLACVGVITFFFCNRFRMLSMAVCCPFHSFNGV